MNQYFGLLLLSFFHPRALVLAMATTTMVSKGFTARFCKGVRLRFLSLNLTHSSFLLLKLFLFWKIILYIIFAFVLSFWRLEVTKSQLSNAFFIMETHSLLKMTTVAVLRTGCAKKKFTPKN